MVEVIEAVKAVVAEAEHTTSQDRPSLEEWVQPGTTHELQCNQTNRSDPIFFSYLW